VDPGVGSVSLLPALALCVATPVAALLLAPSIFRRLRGASEAAGLLLTCLLGVSGPVAAILLVQP
jgi:hypothetical protein